MKRSRITTYLLGVVIGCLLLTIIPKPDKSDREPHPWHAQTAPYGYYPKTVSDDLGRSIMFKDQPRNLVSLAPSVTSMLAYMDLADHLVGATDFCPVPEGLNPYRIGNLSQPAIESIVALRPDLVIGSEMTPIDVYKKIEAAGIQTFVFKHEQVSDVLRDMKWLSLILGVPGYGVEAVSHLESRVEKVQEVVDLHASRKPGSVLIYDLQTLGSAGEGSWPHDLMLQAGARSAVTASASAWPTLSRESLVAADPDIIFLASASKGLESSLMEFKEDPVWRQLKAVQTGFVRVLPENSVVIPGPGMIDAMEFMAEVIDEWRKGPGSEAP